MPGPDYSYNLVKSESLQIDRLVSEISKAFCLTINEARVYLVLLQENSFTASQISTNSGVHRSRVYDTLKSLRGRGLVMVLDDEPRRYYALPIHESRKFILTELRNEYANRVKQVENMCSRLAQLFDNSSTHHESVFIITHDKILDELHSRLRNAKSRVWVCKRAAGGLLDWYLLRNDLLRLSAKDVDIRFLANELVKIGLPSRLNPDVKISFAIIDSIAITFFLDPDADEHSRAVVSQNSEYVEFLAENFINWWNTASD